MPEELQPVITKISYKDNDSSNSKVYDLGVAFKNVFFKESNSLNTEFTLEKLYLFLKSFFETSPFTAWTDGRNLSQTETVSGAEPTDSRIKTWFQVSRVSTT